MKNRERQRDNRSKKKKELFLAKRSESGYKDLTPYNAIRDKITKGRAWIELK